MAAPTALRIVEGSSMDKSKALSAALSQIERQFGKGSVMRLGDEDRAPIEVIPTGSIALDLALGVGGVPRGRIVEIYGPEASGKTTICQHIVASAQKLEKVTASWLPIMQTTAYFVALEEKLFEKAGIEINSVRFENPNQIIDSLVSGQADFGPPGAAAGISMLAESRYPGTFKVFGLQGGGVKVNLINDGLIVKNDSVIQSFKEWGVSIGQVATSIAGGAVFDVRL